MHVSDRLAAVIEQSPFTPMAFDRIKTNSNHEVSRVADKQLKPFPPNHFTPTRGLIFLVEKADAAFLLEQNNACQDEWNRTSTNDQNRAT